MNIEFIDEQGASLYGASIPAQSTLTEGISARREMNLLTRGKKRRDRQAQTCDASSAGSAIVGMRGVFAHQGHRLIEKQLP
jgi:hypothetical protein